MKRMILAAGVVVFLMIACFVGGTIWFGSYVRSESFRGLVAEAAGGAMKSRAELAPLRWSGPSAFAESFRLEGDGTSVLQDLTASQVRANVNWRAMFSGAWRVEEITVTEVEVNWQRPSGEMAEVRPTLHSPPTFLAGFLPRRFELGSLNIGSANMRFADTGIEGSALVVTPDGSGWLLRGHGGRFVQPGVPEMEIKDFQARLQGSDIFLTEGNLRLGANGKVTVSGELSGDAKLQVAWNGVSSEDVFRGGLAKRLVGTLSGTADVSSPAKVEGTVLLQEGRLEGVPVLATIGDFTQNPAFRRMPLQDVKCHFSRESGGWRITDFSAESKGLLRVDGEAFIGDDGALEGTLQVGVTTQTLQWIPGSRERVFTDARGGYLWTEVVLGGSIDHPTENLSARLLSAMGGAVIEKGGDLIRQTPDKAVEGVKSVLDILRPLVP